ncbi:MAG: DUF1244 domain-containing protein [Rhodospirillaceae bacterium]
MDPQTKLELEAAAFRGLVAHLQKRTDVQNIDLMTLSGFCRNCLSKWYLAAARDKGIAMEMDEAKQVVYGMPPGEWKQNYQTPASPEKQAAYEASTPGHAVIEIKEV